jgi:hypothetical protein
MLNLAPVKKKRGSKSANWNPVLITSCRILTEYASSVKSATSRQWARQPGRTQAPIRGYSGRLMGLLSRSVVSTSTRVHAVDHIFLMRAKRPFVTKYMGNFTATSAMKPRLSTRTDAQCAGKSGNTMERRTVNLRTLRNAFGMVKVIILTLTGSKTWRG